MMMAGPMKWLAVLLAAGVLVALFPQTPLDAHPRLLRADPAPGSRVNIPPKAVRVWFKLDPSEELDPGWSLISVWDAREKRVDDGKGGVDLHDLDRLSMIAPLKRLRPGVYTVRWKAVSTPDRAARQGTFRFTLH